MVIKDTKYQVVINTVLIILSLMCVMPFILLLSSSIASETALVKTGYRFWPTEIDLSAYKYLLMDSTSIVRGYAISFFVTIVGTLTSLMLTTLYAYPLSRKNLPGRNIFAFYIFFTMLFNGGLVPGYMMWTQMFHIKNTIFALIVPGLLLNAFNVIMMRTYFTTNIPEEVLEAARIDGGGELYILTKVVLPMSKPIIVTLVDCGVKSNIIRCLLKRGVEVIRVPWDYDFNGLDFDGLFISNGPGDPDTCDAAVQNIRKAMQNEKLPIFGICMGNQLLSKAGGAKIYKLKYGHRSHNQPVRMVGTERCFITSQNHGYAVDNNTLGADWEPLFINMNDGSNEGIRHKCNPWFSAQFHPEAASGPTDTEFLFDEFVKLL